MNKIPTVEEFLDNPKYVQDNHQYNTKLAMIEFAKLHVEAALKEATEKHYLMIDGISEKSNGQKYIVDEGNHYSETEIEVSKDSILNAYSLTNIK